MNKLVVQLKKNHGFTLIEIIIVVMILGILSLIAISVFSGVVVKAQTNTDYANLRILNTSTDLYEQNLLPNSDVFSNVDKDDAKIQELVDAGYLSKIVEAKQKNTTFIWDEESKSWYLFYEETLEIMLTPLGNTFDDISNGIIDAIVNHYDETGNYGRTWGDYRFDDIGLNIDDWAAAVNHIVYKPKGSQMDITPEEGYELIVNDINGNALRVYESYNLIYNVIDGKWYYRDIDDQIIVDISTLVTVEK